MSLNKNNIKKILMIIIISLFINLFLINIKKFSYILEMVFNLINPIIYAFIIAYLLNILVIFFDKKFNKRKLSIFLSILIVISIILLTIIFIIPEIINDIEIIKKNMPKYIEYINNMKIFNNDLIRKIKDINLGKMIKKLNLSYYGLFGKSFVITKNIVYEFTNIFLGIIISIIFLLKKELFISITNKLLKNKLSIEKYKNIKELFKIANRKFQNYFKGQVIESFIITILSFILMLIFKIPYTLSISILIFITTLIPMIGPLIGMILSILLILVISIKKTIYFIIIRFIVNIIDNYFIRNTIMKKELKIPPVLSIISIIYFGLNFGIIGLIIGIPFSAFLYEIFKKRIV